MMVTVANKIISWSFYLLFFLVPLWFYAGSHELFEYNKMMLTYGLTIIVVAAWLVKLVVSGQWSVVSWKRTIPRTPLDIPILLYLIVHILSTIFSLDPHTSLWGYYSRFHEGLFASISYIVLYYAAVSNLNHDNVIRILKLSLISATIVSVYGALEHFGHSPSCLFITGNFNVDCWVQDVKTRVFATLGQPNWMAAYLDVVILTTAGYVLSVKGYGEKIKKSMPHNTFPIILIAFMFAALLFTKSRSGILGLLVGLVVFITPLFWHWLKAKQFPQVKPLLFLLSLLLLLSLLFGLPFGQIEKFNLESFLTPKPATSIQQPVSSPGYIDIGISESGDIRKIVWQGAVKVWQRYPIFGSGVETFAYAYYKDRPVAHNMVSEWDFLYNKAHNEFLNILATTGTVGMIAYLSILGVFTFWFVKYIRPNIKQPVSSIQYLVSSLFAAWVSILVTNFFGFSVVIVGLFFFLIPAFCFILTNPNDRSPSANQITNHQSPATTSSWFFIAFITFIAFTMEWNLLSMWRADKAYAYGKNLDSVQRFSEAYKYLTSAVAANPNEPTFRDELSYSQSVLASAIFQQIESSSESAVASLSAQQKQAIKIPQLDASISDLVQQSIANSNKVVEASPNALTFWKTRTKVFYQLATIDNKYYLDALTAIQKSAGLAPTDAKVHYNLGILYGRVGQAGNAIKALEETVAMKPDYRDAYYALALYYKESGNIAKAKATMAQILTKIGPDPDAQKWLKENQ